MYIRFYSEFKWIYQKRHLLWDTECGAIIPHIEMTSKITEEGIEITRYLTLEVQSYALTKPH